MRSWALCAFAVLAFPTLEAKAEDLAPLLVRCVPTVHPTTMGSLIRAESGGRIFALSDDGPSGLPWSDRKKMIRSYKPQSEDEAIQIAERLIAAGHMVGIGLTQISNRHLARMGLSVKDAFEPCKNVRAGGQVLSEFYAGARKIYKNDHDSLLAAISAYNTGNFRNGFTNGYVRTVLAGGDRLPELRATTGSPRRTAFADVEVREPRQLLLSAKLAAIEVEAF
jgi:type IV secretion system protein VirB1